MRDFGGDKGRRREERRLGGQEALVWAFEQDGDDRGFGGKEEERSRALRQTGSKWSGKRIRKRDHFQKGLKWSGKWIWAKWVSVFFEMKKDCKKM